MDEKQWYWVIHRKGQPATKYPQDEVASISLSPRENVLTVKLTDNRIAYYPVENLDSWLLLELLKTEPQAYTGRMGAY